jgi:hypothetical protein
VAGTGSDPGVLCAAALGGRVQIIRLLVQTIGIPFSTSLADNGESAVANACLNGHDDALRVLLQLGARIGSLPTPNGIRIGSFRRVIALRAARVAIDKELIELATLCCHANVLRLIAHRATNFGYPVLMAWLDQFELGGRILRQAGADFT